MPKDTIELDRRPGDDGLHPESVVTCPACAFHCGFLVGMLADTRHYRCRACGWDFAITDTTTEL